ncbi:MAG: metallophosphoesterase [Gemmatimonadetes bacterium]|nr:metallophosphoesterase [Gemmatimonadota bacterium]
MKIACSADAHLGYRAMPAIRNGRNAREQDIEDAWGRVIDGMVAAQPEIACFAGDLFHRARVSNHALAAYLRGLGSLLWNTQAEVFVLTGNHEASRTAETLSPNALADVLDHPRLHLADRASTWSDEQIQVTLLPFQTGRSETFRFPEKDPGKVNLLAIHGAIQAPGINPFYASESCPHINDLARHFDVIAAGDFHDHMMLENDHGCLAFYAGSIEYSSSNFWPEAPKGWVLADTEARTAEFQPIQTRTVIDLQADDCTDAEALNTFLDALLGCATIRQAKSQPIVRVVVPDFDRSERGGISHDLLKRLKAKCLHFKLDVRTEKNGAGAGTETFHARSLRDMFDEFFAEDPEDVRERAAALVDERWAG